MTFVFFLKRTKTFCNAGCCRFFFVRQSSDYCGRSRVLLQLGVGLRLTTRILPAVNDFQKGFLLRRCWFGLKAERRQERNSCPKMKFLQVTVAFDCRGCLC